MNKFEQVYRLTQKMKKLLDNETSSKNREEVINQLNELIEERGNYIGEIQPPFSEEEEEIINEIYAMNQIIEGKMEHIFSELKIEMRQMQQQKKSKQFYTNPYKDVQVFDGTFLDSKK